MSWFKGHSKEVIDATRRAAGADKQSWRSLDLNVQGLASQLRRTVKGEVRFDAGSRALYATDASNYRQPPLGVVIPLDVDDVIAAVAACRDFSAPVLPRGGGTSLGGQCCNVAVVIDMSKYMHHIVKLDGNGKSAWVQPGTVLDDLRNEAEKSRLTFAPDPATHNHNTLGGMIGNNSCGIHSVMGGKTDDNIQQLDILTYDGLRMTVGETSEAELERIIAQGGRRGNIYARLKLLRDRYAPLIRDRYPDIPRRVSGYGLDHLLAENGFNVARALVGSEGTCVVVLQATTSLVHSPPWRSLLVLGYPDSYTAGDHVPEILESKPVGLEGIDRRLVADLKEKGLHPHGLHLLPDGGGFLLVEFGGENKKEADDKAGELMETLRKKRNPPSMKLFDNKTEEKIIWKVREAGLAATARLKGQKDAWPGWEDSAVHPDDLGSYLRDLRQLLNKYGYHCSLYGHFGQACVHARIDFDLFTAEGVEGYRSFIYEAADLVMKYHGSFSGEHGDGQARGELLPKMFGPELIGAFREFKAIWDPAGKMNPGKIIDPYGIDENLRLGTSYNPPQLKTRFQFPEDRHSFPYAVLRCVGVGECRKEHTGTMCPSYMGTREEKDCTRGRARLLFEMLHGDIVEGWRSDAVRQALELCLACKGCKNECPMFVDMAMYKAEFMHHHYKGHLRPPDAYSMGLIYWWSRLASKMPSLANAIIQTEPLSRIVKRAGGIAVERNFPLFAGQTFKKWFFRREGKNEEGPPVIVWPDTFNNHFYPEVGMAAVEVLERLGYRVHVPRESLCCGRPLFDYGMLDLAKYLLKRILTVLRPFVRKGVPLIGLEPACLVTFRDELINLFPNDEDAQRLAQLAFTLGEFVHKNGMDSLPERLGWKAVVHGHCNHKAVVSLKAEDELFSKMGLDYAMLDDGCCGVAGAFGYRKGNYDLSLKIGNRVLLPAVRGAAKDTVIIADGFSCREQISSQSDRQGMHLAQVLLMAMEEAARSPEPYPERKYYIFNRKNEEGKIEYHPVREVVRAITRKPNVSALAAGLVSGILLGWILKRRC